MRSKQTPKSYLIQKWRRKLKQKKEDLELYRMAEVEILTGGNQSYSIGGRQISRRTYPLEKVREEIRKLEKEIDKLEDRIAGYSIRKAQRAIPRDW